MLQQRLKKIYEEAQKSLLEVNTEALLEAWEIQYLGRKSEFNEILKGLKDLSPQEKKIIGPLGNEIKQNLRKIFEETKNLLVEKNTDWESERIDVTAPSMTTLASGHLHPVTLLENEVQDIFSSMGFALADGPEVETEHYNFDVLNFPTDHPARDMQDTFWLKKEGRTNDRFLLRTHTSAVQVRYMEQNKPPFRVIIPGKVFRNEATDASHEFAFHHFECLMVGNPGEVTIATFKYMAETFFGKFFGQQITVRLRPSFFPFTEPSFEFDISCVICNASGCSACKQTGWLEIGGAGMVNQHVFESAGYKRGQYQGFAWGFGLTRLAMMRYKIPDIRLLMSGDLRFIRQF